MADDFSRAVDELKKEFGDEDARLASDAPSGHPALSTQCPQLDHALGIGGYPKGRLTEIYGKPSSGKTTLALQAMAETHAQGQGAAFIDVEHALSLDYAKALGVAPDKLVLHQPNSAERALEIMESAIRKHAFGVVALDSVAALIPEAESMAEYGDSQVGHQARLMSQGMRKLNPAIKKASETVAIFINQTRTNINTGPYQGNPTTTPGGNALRFYADVRMETKYTGKITKSNEAPIGQETSILIHKNKFGPPSREAKASLIYGHGFDPAHNLIQFSLAQNVLTQKGAYVYWDKDNLGQGAANAAQTLRNDPDLHDKLRSAIPHPEE